MSRRKICPVRVVVAAMFVATALSMSFGSAAAHPVPAAPGSGSFAQQYDPCGTNQYGCHAPYGACDTYQPGCAGPHDPGYKPYDYDDNREDYS